MRIAADANVLLLAAIGGRAGLVLAHPKITEVLTTPTIIDEVQEYIVELARKRRLAVDQAILAASSLPVTVVETAVYRPQLSEARRRIGHRDPDDAELLALALHFRIPVWSNDNDFGEARVPWYTTHACLRSSVRREASTDVSQVFIEPLRVQVDR